ncbi:glycosyltransferase family 4 protein [Rubellicoccus peritrichatus]|uniref:Glycosyltransferase family 4 protein n=1 Tax=Rubellicoccus peritrichatus TaxID=3080537 RepID=A0AAQ3QR06_9BACT|nr:glycosyltransferase family 4 protein [Puniceicoccus sp. CR14]WOO40808.1 glycosyltransferase family 4 protein [Puniceicoccus sp. CR14]
MPKAHYIFALPEWLPKLGGLATFYVQLGKLFCEQGIEVTVLVAQKDLDTSGWPGLRIVNLEKAKNQWRGELSKFLPEDWSLSSYALAHGFAIRDWLIANTKADDKNIVFAAEFLGYASILCDEKLPPIIVTAHGSIGQMEKNSQEQLGAGDIDFIRSLESESLLRADVATAYSPSNAKEWTKALRQEITFVPPPFILPGRLEKQSSGKEIKGIVVGRLQDWKGAIVLAQALEKLPDTLPLSIDWIGADTQSSPKGESMAKWLESEFPKVWARRFNWLGPLPRNEVAQRQSEADFALIPSNWDTLNFTALEAMSAGTPVIISTAAGASYLVESGHNGFVFPAGDADALNKILMQLTNEPSTLIDCGIKARSTMEAQFKPDEIVRRYSELAENAKEAAANPLAYLRKGGTATALSSIIDTLSSGNDLPKRGGRELFSALTQKLGNRIGF